MWKTLALNWFRVKKKTINQTKTNNQPKNLKKATTTKNPEQTKQQPNPPSAVLFWIDVPVFGFGGFLTNQ